MKTSLNKKETQERINEFFSRKNFSPEEVKKIKRLAMKLNIKLGNYRKFFCKKCMFRLKGKLKITKTHKTVECEKCGHRNKTKIEL